MTSKSNMKLVLGTVVLILVLFADGTPVGAADKFTPTGSMETTRRWHTATLLSNGNVLVAGGDTEDRFDNSTALAALYNPTTSSFAPTGNMTTATGLGVATTVTVIGPSAGG